MIFRRKNYLLYFHQLKYFPNTFYNIHLYILFIFKDLKLINFLICLMLQRVGFICYFFNSLSMLACANSPSSLPSSSLPSSSMPSSNMPISGMPISSMPTSIRPSSNMPSSAYPSSSRPSKAPVKFTAYPTKSVRTQLTYLVSQVFPPYFK